MTLLVGGVGELFQGDLDVGRLAVERLGTEGLGADVLVEELHYGAVAVAQRLEELHPGTLVLVGAVRRGRAVGTTQRRRLTAPTLSDTDLQTAVGDAVTGYVALDLVVEVAAGLGALPARTVAIELEPEYVGPRAALSDSAAGGLEDLLEMVRTEVRRAPMLELAAELGPTCDAERLDLSHALTAMCALLDQLALLDREGRWGHAFVLRDRLRRAIAEGHTGEGMDHRDWGLWWALIEELDRLEALEAIAPRR